MQNIKQFLVLSIFTASLLSACDQPKDAETEITTIESGAAESATLPASKIEAVSKSESATASPENENNPEVINFEGFGPAKFGGNEESVRMSWGRPLKASKPAVGATCYYLYIDPKPENHQQIAFMFEDAKFVRYDVDDQKWVAPGNIVVGDTMEKVMSAHAGHIENQPHKYIEGGHTLIVTPEKTEQKNGLSNASLIVETDANNIVINWRIGVSPQVFYVEGCS